MKNELSVVEKITVEAILDHDRVLIMKWKNHNLSDQEAIELNDTFSKLQDWGFIDYSTIVLRREYGFNGWISKK